MQNKVIAKQMITDNERSLFMMSFPYNINTVSFAKLQFIIINRKSSSDVMCFLEEIHTFFTFLLTRTLGHGVYLQTNNAL